MWQAYDFEDGAWFKDRFWDSDGNSPRVYPSLKDAGMDNYLRKVTKDVYSMHPNQKDFKIVGLLVRRRTISCRPSP